MTAIKYVGWMMLFIPHHAAGLLLGCAAAAFGAPGWLAMIPAVVGFGLGVWRGPRV